MAEMEMTPISTLHLLLVEDDAIDAEVIERALGGANAHFSLTVVQDGAAALQWLRSQAGQHPPRPYLILLDLNLPCMNGLEFLRELRQDSTLKRSVVFVLTTSDLPEDKLAAYEYQVAGYLLKSNLDQDNLVKLVGLLDVYRECVEFPDISALY